MNFSSKLWSIVDNEVFLKAKTTLNYIFHIKTYIINGFKKCFCEKKGVFNLITIVICVELEIPIEVLDN